MGEVCSTGSVVSAGAVVSIRSVAFSVVGAAVTVSVPFEASLRRLFRRGSTKIAPAATITASAAARPAMGFQANRLRVWCISTTFSVESAASGFSFSAASNFTV